MWGTQGNSRVGPRLACTGNLGEGGAQCAIQQGTDAYRCTAGKTVPGEALSLRSFSLRGWVAGGGMPSLILARTKGLNDIVILILIFVPEEAS